ncbi:MAG: sugar phosphate isomerase/epimerase [Planctomycetaceae bacterium]|nr:sugar phosphate isomerase/epimerase [Planctomycetaceae bacterium]
MNFQYALPTRCLSSNLKQALLSAARMQVAGIQLDVRQELSSEQLGKTGIRDFRNRLEELNLKVASGAFPLRQAIYDPQWLERRLEALRAAMVFTYQLGSEVLTVRPGRLPDAETRPDEWQVLVEILNELARFGNHSGVTLCLSLSLEFPERAHRLFESVTEGPLGINFDPLNILAGEQRVDEMFRKFHHRVGHIRARDGLRNIDDEVEEYPIGMGAVDWTEFLALLHEADYQGWIVLDRTSGEDRARDLSIGLSYLQQLLPF